MISNWLIKDVSDVDALRIPGKFDVQVGPTLSPNRGWVASKAEAYPYDVALSFAGEERTYVRAVARALAESGVRVFYDEYEQVALWGKDLYSHLDNIYRLQSRYCILFLSKSYADKVWTNHERSSAQARALEAHEEYVLPVKFDATEIPGLRPTIGYVSADKFSPEELADLIVTKLGAATRRPTLPDGLFAYLMRVHLEKSMSDWRIEMYQESDEYEADLEEEGPAFTSADDYDHWVLQARHVYHAFQQMTEVERVVVGMTLARGCAGELPDLVHIDPIELSRIVGLTEDEIRKALSDVRWLGFSATSRDPAHLQEPGAIVQAGSWDLTLTWWNGLLPWCRDSTTAARALLFEAGAACCDEHAMDLIRACDFSGAGGADPV